MRNFQAEILNDSDATSVNGDFLFSGQYIAGSFQPVFSDTDAAGTVKLQFSNDVATNKGSQYTDFTPTNWKDIPNASSTITAGVGAAIVLNTMCFAYIRAVWTAGTPGTGTVRVLANFLSN